MDAIGTKVSGHYRSREGGRSSGVAIKRGSTVYYLLIPDYYNIASRVVDNIKTIYGDININNITLICYRYFLEEPSQLITLTIAIVTVAVFFAILARLHRYIVLNY